MNSNFDFSGVTAAGIGALHAQMQGHPAHPAVKAAAAAAPRKRRAAAGTVAASVRGYI